MSGVRPRSLALAALLAAACQTGTVVPSPPPSPPPSATATASAAPTATAPPTAAASPSPSATVTPMPTTAFPRPSADPAAGVGTLRAVRTANRAADASHAISVRGGPTRSAIEVLDVASGALRTIAHPREAMIGDRLELSRGLLVYFDVQSGPEGMPRTFGVWRLDLTAAAPAPMKLDEFPAVVGFGGGDTINPWPSPQTNGSDVAWLRARESGGPAPRTHEIVSQRGIAPARVVHTGPVQPFFGLGDDGRVAIVTAASGRDQEATLLLYDPGAGIRQLARRPAESAGLVSWVTGKVAWFDSAFNVRPASRADLFDVATGASTPFTPPAGCGLGFPTTRRHVQVICFGGLTAVHDMASGRVVPLAPAVIASREALMMRSTAEFASGEDAWLHAAVLPP